MLREIDFPKAKHNRFILSIGLDIKSLPIGKILSLIIPDQNFFFSPHFDVKSQLHFAFSKD